MVNGVIIIQSAICSLAILSPIQAALLPTLNLLLKKTFVTSMMAKTARPRAPMAVGSENEGLAMPKASRACGI
jgi:hypothetical protein